MSERMKANRASGADAYADMAGKTYGMLTVLSVDPTDSQKVVCMCQCKNLVSLQASYVLSGRTKSCGCQAQNTIIPNGTKYGSLTVVGNRVEKHQRKYICKCDCGKEIVTWKHNLERGLSSCGCQTDKSVYGAWQREQAAKRLSSLIGKRRGRLVCTAVDPEDPTHITVRCDCGTEKKIPKKSFTKPSSTTYSCGCFIRELSRLPKSKKAEYIEQFKAEYGL